eukprot:CAMPEP_0119031412 /NCGR_PEP_ID=MMETSP1176-20130426/41530_1 /TAXON_ID=265551 /ORGANISM="Synedropsis recta cf, Strain CCMP1620" /LENGTH=326 /DNA_ID=CAMNT_0006987807 /DNA_START=110 /DNA_END=1087 /DNA_ORIENTATION=+
MSDADNTLPLTTTTSNTVSSINNNNKRNNNNNNSHPFFIWTTPQIRDTIICAVVCWMGWNLPTLFFYPTLQQIENQPIPLQQLQFLSVNSNSNTNQEQQPQPQPQSQQFLLDARYNHPLVDPATVSGDFLVLTGLWLPLLMALLVEFMRRHQNPHLILCTLFLTIGISEAATNLLKFWVLRPRPNYYALCGLDMTSTATASCTAPFEKVVQAQLSFPSGHTSLSFCSTTVLVVWFFFLLTTTTSKQQQQQQRSSAVRRCHTTKLQLFLACGLPWTWATFVAVSRIVDHWHHPSDILAGCLLGSTCAIGTFLIMYSNGSGMEDAAAS